jgi:hypothetical protein
MMAKLEGEEREHMEALVEDLIHGNHEKGTGKLHIITPEGSPDRWCCLGRAGAVAVAGGCQVECRVTVSRAGDLARKIINVEEFGDSTEILCAELREWYGLDSSNPLLRMYDGMEIPAASVNDSGHDKEYTLPEIGELFRRTYLESPGDSTISAS